MLSGSSKNVSLKVSALGCGTIDQSVSEVLGNFGKIYLHSMFTGIRELSRAGRCWRLAQVTVEPACGGAEARAGARPEQTFRPIRTPCFNNQVYLHGRLPLPEIVRVNNGWDAACL